MPRISTRLLAVVAGTALLAGSTVAADAAPAAKDTGTKSTAQSKQALQSAAKKLAADLAKSAPKLTDQFRRHRAAVRSVQDGVSTYATQSGESVKALAVSAPAEGTFVNYEGDVFKVVGGALLYVSSWANVPRTSNPVVISDAEFALTNPWPKDGTFVRATNGRIYRFAGGAPLYVSSWTPFGKSYPAIDIDGTDIDHTDVEYPYYAVRPYTQDYNLDKYDPEAGNYNLDGNLFIRDPKTGRIYKMADGVPVYISKPALLPGVKSVVDVDPAVITNASGTGIYRFVRKHIPDDGFPYPLRSIQDGDLYIPVGGSPLYLPTLFVLQILSSVGFSYTAVNVDETVINASSNVAPYNNLLFHPAEGSYGAALSETYGTRWYRFDGGRPVETGVEPEGDFGLLDQAAVDHAGQRSPWDHLLAPLS